MEIEEEMEELLNETADNIDGALAVLEDLKGPYTRDARLHAAIAALKHTRETFDPILDRM